MSIFKNPEFQARVKHALIFASEHIEADAESLRENSTVGGCWDDRESRAIHQFWTKKVAEMTELLRMIHEDGNGQ